MKNIMDVFFSLGDKVTRGDPRRQQDFTYYMLWILFLAFLWLFGFNLYSLINGNLGALTLTLVGFAIMSLQFFNLKAMYDMRKLRKNPKPPEPVESVDEMMKSFNEAKGGYEKNGVRKSKSDKERTDK